MIQLVLVAIFINYLFAGVITNVLHRKDKNLKASRIINGAAVVVGFGLSLALLLLAKQGETSPVVLINGQWFGFKQVEIGYEWLLDELSLYYLVTLNLMVVISVFIYGIREKTDAHLSSFYRYMAPLAFFVNFAILSGGMTLFLVGWVGISLFVYLISQSHENVDEGRRRRHYIVGSVSDGLIVLSTMGLVGLAGVDSFSDLALFKIQMQKNSALILSPVILIISGVVLKLIHLMFEYWRDDLKRNTVSFHSLLLGTGVMYIGVYFLCRLSPIIINFAEVMNILLVVGLIIILFGLIQGLIRDSLTKVLSGIYNINTGLIFLYCGIGFFQSAFYLVLLSTAWMTLLYLLVGRIYHVAGSDDITEIRLAGWDGKKWPIVVGCALISLLWILTFFPGAFGDMVVLHAIDEKSGLLLTMVSASVFISAIVFTRPIVKIFFRSEIKATPKQPLCWTTTILVTFMVVLILSVGVLNIISLFSNNGLPIIPKYFYGHACVDCGNVSGGYAGVYRWLNLFLMIAGMVAVYVAYLKYRSAELYKKIEGKLLKFRQDTGKIVERIIERITMVLQSGKRLSSVGLEKMETYIFEKSGKTLDSGIINCAKLVDKYKILNCQKEILIMFIAITLFVFAIAYLHV